MFPKPLTQDETQHIADAIYALYNMGFTNDTFQLEIPEDIQYGPNITHLNIIHIPIRKHISNTGFVTIRTGNSLGGGNTGHIHIQSGRGKTP
jgi:hypothetical protein